jgi:hypothetical protein
MRALDGGFIAASAQSTCLPTDRAISGWLQCDQAAYL